ncbi:SGNH/GDSL hydrolase family protein [candidate division WS5 bacterium]|uniref:SGNH/GDSL hydrolase family protein n=1 Tax=candidate division WS5 bacterium TaxID=2093353 RepID=A0A419DGG5_9BACT|nr:MAG: SGNH/GDSL hydrolase family protein [candidate division WS5 bacterium]
MIKISLKHVVYSFVMLCLSLIIVLMLGEVLLRFFWVKPTGVDLSGITVKDETLGYRFVPNSSAIITGLMNDYQTSVKINSYGFRGREHDIENKLKKKRIILIGDSVVFGLGTGEEDNIDTAMERLLNANNSNSYEVINLGMPGIGTLAEEQILIFHGLLYKPGIVIFFVNAINDLGDNVNYYNSHSIQVSSKTNNRISSKSNDLNTFHLFKISESYLFNFIKWQMRPFILKSQILRKAILFFYKPSVEDLPSFREWYTEEGLAGFSLMKAAFERISVLGNQHNFKINIAVIPSRPQFDKSYEYLSKAVLPPDILEEYNKDPQKPQRLIREFCKDKSIGYIELLDDLIYLQNKSRDIPLTHPNDGHPKAQYSKEVARIVVGELQKRVL